MGKQPVMAALLDTHVLIWWLNDRTRLSPRQRDVVEAATGDAPVHVSGYFPLGGGNAAKPGSHSVGIAAP